MLCLTSWSPLCLNAKMLKCDSTRTSCSPSKRRNSCLSTLSLATSSPILYSNASTSLNYYEENLNHQTWSQGSLSYPTQFSIKFRFSNFAKHYDVAVINSIIQQLYYFLVFDVLWLWLRSEFEWMESTQYQSFSLPPVFPQALMSLPLYNSSTSKGWTLPFIMKLPSPEMLLFHHSIAAVVWKYTA